MNELSFNYSPAFLILIALVSAPLAWWMYKGTVAYLPRLTRIILGVFRFVVLFLIAAMLLEPMINFQSRIKYPPVIAVLQDVSESIVIQKDSAFAKQDHTKNLEGFINDFNSDYQVELYGFSNELSANLDPDSIRYKQTGTNISNALEEIGDMYQNQNLGALVLISDGISTAGTNPLYAIDQFRQPVYTVLLGDTTVQRDIKITEVLNNEIAYLNTETPVKVKVSIQGFDDDSLKVTLKGEGKVIGSKKIILGTNKDQGEVDFSITPSKVGLQQYQVQISSKPGEISYRNNQKRIFINVLETKVKIALFAGSPHPDLGALRQAFKREESYEVTEFILKGPGKFYEDPTAFNLQDFDLFILHNFPHSNADANMVKKIQEEIKERKKPVMHFVGMFTDLPALNPLYDYMAITPKGTSPKSEEVIVNFSEAYEDHSTFTFGNNWIDWMNATPPIFRNKSNWVAKSTADVFATARIKNIALDYPVYAVQNHLGRKNVVFLGENFWRMRASSLLETESFDNFDEWLFNNIKWLRVSDDKRKFKVRPSKKVFTGSEPVIFKGQVYDDSYNPVTGVDIKLTLTSPDGKENDYYMNETGRSQYYLELFNLEEGTYRFSAEGTKNNLSVGTDGGQFSVGKSNVEHFQLRADQDLMRQLAIRTGGEFLYAADLGGLPATLKELPGLKPVVDFKKSRKSFHNYWWVLILVLGLASIEWIVRKWFSLL